MKCPFCNAELHSVSDNIAMCQNIQCEMWHKPAYKTLWGLAIDGKKAQEALDFVKMHIESLQTAAELCLENNRGDVRAYERDIEIAKLLQTAISSHQPDQPKEE